MALRGKNNRQGKYSQEFLDSIQAKDFLGRLSPAEIEIAAETGLLKWNSWAKNRRKRIQSRSYYPETG